MPLKLITIESKLHYKEYVITLKVCFAKFNFSFKSSLGKKNLKNKLE